jgi:hypothetical protein
MGLSDRINRAPDDRRTDDVTPMAERRKAEFMAPWRRRQIEKAGGRFVAVAWRDVA